MRASKDRCREGIMPFPTAPPVEPSASAREIVNPPEICLGYNTCSQLRKRLPRQSLGAFHEEFGPFTGRRASLEEGTMLSTSTGNLPDQPLAATSWIQRPDWLLPISERSATSKPRRWPGIPAIREEKR
jgi:hypothetical protein